MTAVELDEYQRPEEAKNQDRERFRIDTDEQATWAIRKLRSLRSRKAEIDKIAADEEQRIRDWRDDALSSLTGDDAYFAGILIDYARRQRDAEGRKSISLPYGTIKSRAAQPRVQVTDPAGFMAWARASHPDMIRIKEEPDLTAIKAAADISGSQAVDPSTGEIIPGVAVEQRDATYTVEVTL
jgi:phage host-nuclease inhibitor protein Gam